MQILSICRSEIFDKLSHEEIIIEGKGVAFDNGKIVVQWECTNDKINFYANKKILFEKYNITHWSSENVEFEYDEDNEPSIKHTSTTIEVVD